MSQQIQISGGAKVRDLQDVIIGTSGVLSSLAFDVANGVPKLDSNGKILVSQLPNSVMEYKGTWNAATNTPTLVNGTGNQGDVYLCNVAGTVDFGAGPIAFVVGDQVIYSGSIWQRASGATGTVTSVAITESGDSLNITGSPITTSGTINIGFNGTNLQYVNGAGNLTTFPDLTGYVPYTGATQNVDLGVFDLTADLITGATGSFASSGGSDTFAINHSSGAGIALNITKGGNGEGLYINKTSGSGNAATIIGTLEATTLVKNGGTSSQFLKADGTVDSNTYALDSLVVHLAGTETITGAKTFSGYTTFTSTVDITSGLTFSNSGFTLLLQPPTLSVNRTVTLPNGTGTLALTSDISYPVTSVFGRTGAVVATEGDYSLTQLSDVTITTPSSSQLLQYNGTSWVNWTPNYITGNQTITLSGDVSGSGSTAITTTIGALKVTNAMLAGSIDLTTKVTGLLPDGNISSAATWNAKQNAITLTTTGTSGAATLVGATLNIPQYTDAYTGTVTSVAALTIGTTGTDLSSSVANSTTTPVITLNVPTASATNRGALSSADWTTFNNKQGALTNPVTGTGTTNYLPKFTGTSTIGNSQIFDNGTNVGIGTALPNDKFSVVGNVNLGNNYTASYILDINKTTDFDIRIRKQALGGTVGILFETANDFSGTSQAYIKAIGTGSNGRSQLIFGTAANVGDTTASEKMRLDASGNLGLGVTPSAWGSSWKALDISSVSSLASQSTITRLYHNGYNDGSSNLYKTSAAASMYSQDAGAHQFFTAPSGTAGNAISFTQAMTLDASGRLGIGTTSPSGLLQLNGSIATSGDAATFTIKQSSTTYTNGIYLERGGERNGYYMYIGGAVDSLTFRRNYFGTQSDVMALTRDGNVGIGTTTDAGYKLDVNGTLRVTGAATFSSSVTAATKMSVGTSSTLSAVDMWIHSNSSTNVNVARLALTTDATGHTASDGSWIHVENSGLYIDNYENDIIAFGTNATERMRITSNVSSATLGSGGVMKLLGTSGAVGVYTELQFYTYNAPTNQPPVSLGIIKTDNGGYENGEFYIATKATNANTAPTERMRITSGGRVGIGQTSPGVALSVAGQSEAWQLALTSVTGTAGAVIGSPSANVLAFGDWGGTERMRITSGGNVLIGTTTNTNHKLTVHNATDAGQIRVTGGAPTIYFTDTLTDPANYVGLLGMATGANNFITGTAAGDFVLLNQTNSKKLYVVNYSGGVYLSSGATSWTANSDIRLKNINSHIENAVEKLSTLQTINFSYKDDKANKQNLGLIAQEVEKIFPELIDKNGDGMLGVRYTELVPVLIKAVQELKLEIETLKNK